jgi:hypothetical protein
MAGPSDSTQVNAEVTASAVPFHNWQDSRPLAPEADY